MSKQPVRRPVKAPARRVVKKKPVEGTPQAPSESVSNEVEPVAATPMAETKTEPKERNVVEQPRSSTPSSSDDEPKRKGLLPLILVVLILFIVCGVLGWRLQGVKEELATKDKEIAGIEAAKEQALKDANAKIDQMIAEYKALEEQSKSIGADNADLLARIDDLEAQKAYLAQKAARGSSGMSLTEINSLRAELEKKDEELKKKEEQILHYKKVITKQKGQMTQLIEKQGKMVSEMNTLEEQVSAASVLFLETVQPGVINWGGEFLNAEDAQYKNKKIDKIRVVATIGDNKVAQHGEKTFWLKLQDPDGNTLFDTGRGGGTQVDSEGETISITSTKNVVFDNTGEKIIFDYAQPKEYKNGTYKVVVYDEEGHKVGSSEFDLY